VREQTTRVAACLRRFWGLGAHAIELGRWRRCYLRLSDNPRAREALRQCLPELLRKPQFTACLKDDVTTRRCEAVPASPSPSRHAQNEAE
jgi:Cell differentiation family, Rcd1-like